MRTLNSFSGSLRRKAAPSRSRLRSRRTSHGSRQTCKRWKQNSPPSIMEASFKSGWTSGPIHHCFRILTLRKSGLMRLQLLMRRFHSATCKVSPIFAWLYKGSTLATDTQIMLPTSARFLPMVCQPDPGMPYREKRHLFPFMEEDISAFNASKSGKV